MSRWSKSFCFLASLSLAFASLASNACTRVLYAPNPQTVLVGNNMDWMENMPTNLYVLPAGLAHVSQVKDNPVRWTSKYGSLVAVSYDVAASNGLNEKGLAAHLLALRSSDYGVRDSTKPGLLNLEWAQFYLDNFNSVAQAVQFTQTHPLQIVAGIAPTIGEIKLHLALDDASGDSAIIEYVGGSAQIYHGRDKTVLTNDPTFDQQVENLKHYQGFGGTQPLPGTTYAGDRFVRASFYLAHLPEFNTTRAAVFGVFSVLQNAGQPIGTISPERPLYGYSNWRTVTDLVHRIYYFNSTTTFGIHWTDLTTFNLASGAPVMKLDLVNGGDLMGNVSGLYKPAPAFN